MVDASNYIGKSGIILTDNHKNFENSEFTIEKMFVSLYYKQGGRIVGPDPKSFFQISRKDSPPFYLTVEDVVSRIKNGSWRFHNKPTKSAAKTM